MSLNNVDIPEFVILVNREKIRELIYKFDKVFINSVIKNENFSNTLDKIVNHGIVICAMKKERIVGYCAFYMNDFESNTIYISLLAVDDNWQGKHIGTNIIEYIKKLGRINGFEKIRLEVNNSNITGIKFYKNNNFYFGGQASKNSNYMELLL